MWYLVAALWIEARLCMISAMANCNEWVLLDFINSGVITGNISGGWSLNSFMILYSAAIIRSSREPRPLFLLPPTEPLPSFSGVWSPEADPGPPLEGGYGESAPRGRSRPFSLLGVRESGGREDGIEGGGEDLSPPSLSSLLWWGGKG